MKTFRAAMYVRLSNSDDIKSNEESNSIVNQKRLIEDYVEKHFDIEIVSEKVDDGYSGIIFERPAFKEMMNEIEEGIINCVIVKDLSRFGREYIETGRYLQKIFPAYGVRFIAINDNIDTAKEININDGLITSFKSLINDSYCRDISIKTRTSLEIKRAKGEFIGASVKYGYKKSKDNKNKLVIDEYPAEIVRDIFKMRIEGFSSKSIADKFNERGILSPIEYRKKMGLPYSKGGYGKTDTAKWSATTIIRMLTDEVYIGHMVQGKQTTVNYKLKKPILKPEDEWVKVENTHEPIVSKETFELVKRVMLLDTRTAPHSDSLYIFSGILVCGYCGNRMTRKIVYSRGKKYIYYTCPITKKQGCNGEMIREDKLIECTVCSLKSHIESVISLDEILDEANKNSIKENKISKLKESIELNKDKLNKINSYKATLYKNMIDGVLNKEEHNKYKENYNIKIDEIKKAIEILNNEINSIQSEADSKWIEFFKNISDTNTLDRKTLISLVNSIVVVSKTLIKINFNYQQDYDRKLTDVNQSKSLNK